MTEYVSAERGLRIDTPLGPDRLLLVGVSGREYLSRPFRFELDLVADNRQDVPFESLLGKPVTAHLRMVEGGYRHLSGICVQLTQGDKSTLDDDRKSFTPYSMVVVPSIWRMSRRSRSRIFQHVTVPDILRKVIGEYGFPVTYDVQGEFFERDYCVQYRETDFNFVSRLMEEEGIFYYFTHAEASHTLVVSNVQASRPDVPGKSALDYQQTRHLDESHSRVFDWRKSQELKAGKVSLWDHTFELPHKHLEVDQTTLEEVTVGSVSHVLALAENEELEVHDWPGEYAQRFDGVDRGGGDRPGELQKIFVERERVIKIRMQQEETGAIVVRAGSNAPQMTAGHRFTLRHHFNADGRYLVYAVQHVASEMTYRSDGDAYEYDNRIVCLPDAQPFVPPLATGWPTAKGTQSAVVVGPAGEEIFTDKYGRVKVQFHWDREGKGDEDSSCWIRVATTWAGRQWGAIRIPRVGQEVVVAFEEGDPDKPIVVGSVYNADTMPPYRLPEGKTRSGVVSRSTLRGGPQNFNEISFEDRKGEEKVVVHAEKDLSTEVEASESRSVGGDRSTTIGQDDTLAVGGDLVIKAKGSVRISSGEGAATQEMTAGGTVRIQGAEELEVTFGGAIVINGARVAVHGGAVSVHGDAVVKVKASGEIALVSPVVACSGVLSATAVVATTSVTSPAFIPA